MMEIHAFNVTTAWDLEKRANCTRILILPLFTEGVKDPKSDIDFEKGVFGGISAVWERLESLQV